jgi:PKD repeat protein
MAGSKISRSPTTWTYEHEVGAIYPKVVVGASGAVTSFKGAGVASVVRNSTGNYTITLSATYQRLLFASGTVVNATATSVAAVQVFQAAATVQSSFKSTGAITVQLLDFAGAAVDAPSGSHLWFKLDVRFSPTAVFD